MVVRWCLLDFGCSAMSGAVDACCLVCPAYEAAHARLSTVARGGDRLGYACDIK